MGVSIVAHTLIPPTNGMYFQEKYLYPGIYGSAETPSSSRMFLRNCTLLLARLLMILCCSPTCIQMKLTKASLEVGALCCITYLHCGVDETLRPMLAVIPHH
ncbi:hypothetical protein VPH35_065860 [Triticum aestivum]